MSLMTVVNKSLPFIKQNIDKDLTKQKSNNQNKGVKSFNSQNIEYDNIFNLNLYLIQSKLEKIGEKERKKNQNEKVKKKNDNDEYQSYLKDAWILKTGKRFK